uniref:Uncharacterized protein n=1 Tax=Oryza meridionalis TaxID=40149 RepID=A0A0E0ECT9_9ORYZ
MALGAPKAEDVSRRLFHSGVAGATVTTRGGQSAENVPSTTEGGDRVWRVVGVGGGSGGAMLIPEEPYTGRTEGGGNGRRQRRWPLRNRPAAS